MKIVFLSLLIALLGGCASVPPAPILDHTYTARSQSARVKFIVLHYTVSDLPGSIRTLTQDVVSAHYLLTDEAQPKFYTLVDESRQSNHAGVSSWKTYANLNPMSIGIEIVNPGYKDTPEGRVWYPFSQAQMAQLIPLLQQIVARYQIPMGNILGHSDVAPQRKVDPGPLFPWKQLADVGLIPWPDAVHVASAHLVYDQQLPDVAWFQTRLAQFGYTVPRTGELDEATRNVLIAFQMKYRQARFDGTPDAETAAILAVLTEKMAAAVVPAPTAVPAAVPAPAAPAPVPVPVPAISPAAPPAPSLPPVPATTSPVE